MSRPLRAGVALAVLVVAVAVTVVSVKAADGAFAGDYRLTGVFPRAGEGLHPGSEVVSRGVQVGRVSAIALTGSRARVTMLVDPGVGVPRGTKATIDPVNLFGAEQVTLSAPARPGGGDLAPGATLTRTATADALGSLFTAAAPFLATITRASLATVVGELARASDGEGPRIRASIDAGASLAGYFDQTLAAQLSALSSFSSFTAALAPDGAAINGLAHQENVALPAFDAEAADYSRLLANLTSFSSGLARLLTDYHPTLVTLLRDGANPVRVLTAQQTEIGQVIRGAYRYAYKVASAESQQALPTGSHFVYFNTFVMFSDVNALVCDLIAPPSPGLSFLEPLQQALAGAGSAFTCKAQLAAFDSAQATGVPPPATPGTPTVPSPPATTRTPVSRATHSLGTAVYRILGQPSASRSGSIGGYIGSLLGGQP